MGEASNPETVNAAGRVRAGPAQKKPKNRISVYGGMHMPRWGKGIQTRASRLAGPVRVGRIEDLPEDHPARQSVSSAEHEPLGNDATSVFKEKE